MLSGQQNQLASGQQPAVAAQYMLSGQQNQLASGQQPAVAAQYMLSGQQNQLASGQQPAGQEVSSGPHCLFLAIFMSWAFLATKGQAAEPVGLWAAASGAGGLIRSTLPVLGHLHELGLLGNKGAVSSSGSTVHVVRAAEPVGLRAAASWAGGLIRSTLLVLGHLHELSLLGDKGAVSSSGSTVHVVGAAEPVGLRAAASRAGGLIRSTLPVLGHLHELGLLGDK